MSGTRVTELIVLASTVLAVITELPVSSTACRALMKTVLLPTKVTLVMGTTQCLRQCSHSHRMTLQGVAAKHRMKGL